MEESENSSAKTNQEATKEQTDNQSEVVKPYESENIHEIGPSSSPELPKQVPKPNEIRESSGALKAEPARPPADLTKEVNRLNRLLKKHEERYLELIKDSGASKTLNENLITCLSKLSGNKISKASLEAASDIGKHVEETVRAYFKSIEPKPVAPSVNQHLKRIDELKAENSKLLQDQMTKTEIIKNLQAHLSELESQSYDSLMQDLQTLSTKKDVSVEEKIKEADKTSEILRLKQEISSLREHLGLKMSTSGKSEHAASEKDQENTFRVDKAVQTVIESSIKVHSGKTTSDDQKNGHFINQSIEDTESEGQKLQVYLKDVVTKFFTFDSKTMEMEKRIALNAIFDALKFSFDEKVKVEKHIFKKSMFW